MSYTEDKGTTSISLVREAVWAATRRGLDVSAALQQARIDPALLDSAHARVSVPAFARLWSTLSELLDDEFFGIDSHPMRRGSFDLMCHAVLDCETLGQALQRMLSFLRVVLDDIHGELCSDGEHAGIVLHDGGVVRRLFGYGTWLILVHGLACWLIQRRIPIRTLHFRAARPADDSDYVNRFCDAVVFDAPISLVRFDRRFLDLKLLQGRGSLKAFLSAAPENLLVRYRNDAGTSAQIRRTLRGMHPEQWPELDPLALSLGLSSSTLQRRLQAEGMNYQRLKDDLRRDIAIDLLSDTSLTVTEVAAQIGYQETSAFHRAFKKWTGVSPGAYRRTEDGAMGAP